MSQIALSEPPRPSNLRTALICAAVIAVMVAAAFAAVPVYKRFCQATGFGGATQRAETAPTKVLARSLLIRFDTNVRGLPWDFRAEKTNQTLKIGATGLAFFTVTNTSDKPLTGRASYNVVPEQAGTYFNKLQCFCFNDQTIAAHTTMRFPVVYFVDPAFASDPETDQFREVTLSYTFFPATDLPKASQALGGKAPARL